MLRNSFRWFGCVVILTASVCVAQEPEGPEKGKDKKDRPKRTAKGPRGKAGGARLDRLIKELELDEEQQTQVRAIFKEHQEKTRELRDTMRQGPETREKMKELREAMLAAREAGDEEQMQEIRDQLRTFHDETQAARAPILKKMDAAEQELHDRLASVMSEDQLPRFEESWKKWRRNRRPSGPQRTPRALKTIVGKLPDLTSDQEHGIQAAFEEFKKASREADKETPEYRKLTRKLYDDVLGLLTEEQRQEVSKKLRGRRGDERRRDRENRRRGGRRSNDTAEPEADDE